MKDKHCYIHHVDEPDGVYACGECGHSWPTWQALLDDHNTVTAELAAAFNFKYFETTDPVVIYTCPHCAHDF